ncbi:MAG: T9SS type A sorting domain-containing protein, partial [Sphingomonadales bacterium]
KVKHTIQLNGCEASDSQSIGIAKLSNIKHRMDAIRLFPNPANNKLQLFGISGSVIIEITDFTGKALIRRASSEHTLEISLDGLPEGQYYLTVFSKEYHKVIPFTKIR